MLKFYPKQQTARATQVTPDVLAALDRFCEEQGIKKPDTLPDIYDWLVHDAFGNDLVLKPGDFDELYVRADDHMAAIGQRFMDELMKITELEDAYTPYRTDPEPWGILAELRQDVSDLEYSAAPQAIPKLVAAEPDDVDALSFAARTAHIAAGELYGLMMTANGMRLEDWYGSPTADLELEVRALAEFVTREQVDNPETLWLFATSEGLVVRQEADRFADLTFARRQAFTIFAQVCSGTYRSIRKVQEATAAEAAARKAAANQPPLMREDSILEEHGRLDDMIPGADEFLQTLQRSALDHDGDGRPGGAKPVQPATRPLSIGEAPPRPPVNVGGRGNRESP